MAAEDGGRSTVVAVTSARLLVADKHRGVRSIDPRRISATRLGRLPAGTAPAMVDGPGLVLRFAEMSTANAVAAAVDDLLRGPAPEPPAPRAATRPAAPPSARSAPVPARDILVLLRAYYDHVLFATGTPEAPENAVASSNSSARSSTSTPACGSGRGTAPNGGSSTPGSPTAAPTRTASSTCRTT